MKNKKPNLFLVGAPKAGTTSIYRFLQSHPDIFMSPIKEPHYFSKDIKSEKFSKDYSKRNYINLDQYFSNNKLPNIQIAFLENYHQYMELYRDKKDEKYFGEGSTGYLFSRVAAKEIYNFNPDAKIIMILRNPVERTFSHWRMDSRAGYSRSDNFYKDIIFDYSLEDNTWGGVSSTYIQLGLYSQQVKRYLEYFPKENVKIFFYDEFEKNPEDIKKELFNFLNVQDVDIDFSKRYNTDFKARNFLIHFLFKKYRSQTHFFKNIIPKKIKSFLKNIFFQQSISNHHPINKDVRMKILSLFLHDISNLEKIIDKDLSTWKV